MIPTWITFGCLVPLAGSLLAAIIALAKYPGAHRLSLSLLALVNAIGFISSVAFLLAESSGVVLRQTPLFYGSVLAIDPLSALFYAVVCLVASLSAVYAMRYVSLEYPHDAHRINFFSALFVFGMLGVLLAGNPVGFLFFWEVMSIAPFFLVMTHKDAASTRAALFYLIMTHLGAGALLAAFAFVSNGYIFASFGELSAGDVFVSPAAMIAAFVLFLFGFGSKAGLVPFHVWLPEAHPQAPSHVSALMSGVMLKIAVYGFLRMLLLFFPALPAGFGIAVIAIGLLSALYGVLYAVLERDVKRTLAFSSIENIGLIFVMIGTSMLAQSVGLPSLAAAALLAALFQSVCHAIFKSGLFMGAGVMVHAVQSRSLEKMGGLAKRMPLFSFVMLLLILGAAALPPFGAFAGEWFFLQALVQALGEAPLGIGFVFVGVLSGFALTAGLAVYAMVKLFGIGFLGAARSPEAEAAKEPSAGLLVPIAVLAMLTLLLGVGAALWMYGLLPIIAAALPTGLPATSGALFTPGWIALILATMLAFAIAARSWLSNRAHERTYHTWDCGQPITSGMEYTATAFSGPVRFMFRPFLRIRKHVHVTPLSETNPWIARRELVLNLRSVWFDLLYTPVVNIALRLSSAVKRVQSGIMQMYIGLILLALVVTMIVAL